jgi:glycerophosphoryl diester phosphodiesterase
MGADAVELDVFVLKCGTLIVFHGGGSDENPGTLDDYCGVQGKSILDLTYQQALNELTFNPDFAEFPCPTSSILAGQIPTLEQVLEDAKQSGLHVKIELKGPGTVEPSLEVVERLDMLNQCSFSSFDLERLAYFRELRPDTQDYQTGALFFNVPDDYIQQAQACGATEIHLRYDTCTFDVITAIHEAGFGSMAWCRGPIGMGHDCLERFWDVGNEDESMYEALLRTGVQQLCINKPDVLIGLRTKLLLQSVQQSDTNDETTPSFVQQETPGQIEASA